MSNVLSRKEKVSKNHFGAESFMSLIFFSILWSSSSLFGEDFWSILLAVFPDKGETISSSADFLLITDYTLDCLAIFQVLFLSLDHSLMHIIPSLAKLNIQQFQVLPLLFFFLSKMSVKTHHFPTLLTLTVYYQYFSTTL